MNWYTTAVKKPQGIPKENMGGDCYRAAGRYILDKGIVNPNLTLVHGFVTGQGSISGVRYDHAWIEDGDMVIDKSNGRDLNIPKALYYALGNISPSESIKYNPSEARKKILDNKHWGPWDLNL